MSKLIKYEFRKTWITKLVMLGITAALEALYLVSLYVDFEDTLALAIGLLTAVATMGVLVIGLESVLTTPEARLILSEALEKVRADFDLILIDCPPDMGWCTINALSACDFLFVPMKMSGKSFQGVGKIANLCYQAAKHTYINGIFFTEYYANRKSTKKYEAKARNTYGGTVMQTVIRPCSKLGECADEFKDIIAFDPKCNGAQDYTALWDEMCRIMEMCKKGIM